MSSSITIPKQWIDLPDHTQLPDKDGVPVMNFHEQPQGRLLTDTLEPTLQQLHPDGRYLVGRDNGIYWRYTDPPLLGCKSPDWFYVPGVEPLPPNEHRRSYVLWQEIIVPEVVLEYASGDGAEERDRTPMEGKFWVYERGIRIPFYGIFVFDTSQLEVYELVRGRYRPMKPNANGRFFIEPLGVELGLWQGRYETANANWLRWWDAQGNLLLTGSELAERYATKLRDLGVDPKTL